MDTQHRVVIIGGGFGGLFAARALKRAPVQVTLIDRRNFHLFQPLLYQVATGGLSAANIAAPLRVLLKRQKNAEVRLGDVVDFDVTNRQVLAHRRRQDRLRHAHRRGRLRSPLLWTRRMAKVGSFVEIDCGCRGNPAACSAGV